jgi:hypothetical protein
MNRKCKIKVAFLHPISGEIFIGLNHYEAIKNSGFVGNYDVDKCEGFVVDDVFLTRQETYNLTGIVCLEWDI